MKKRTLSQRGIIIGFGESLWRQLCQEDTIKRLKKIPSPSYQPRSSSFYFLFLLSLGHLIVDMHSGGITLLFPLFQTSYGLNYAQLGMLMLVSQITSSVIQPAFGIISDRVSTRALLPVSLLITTAGAIGIAFASTYATIMIGVIIMGLGITAYHPESSKLVHLVGGEKKGRAMATFALGGNIGLALGPLLVGAGIALFGSRAALMYIPPTFLTLFLLQRSLRAIYDRASEVSYIPPDPEDSAAEKTSISKNTWKIMGILLVAITLRSGANASLMTFIPVYYTNLLGNTTGYSSLLLTSFLTAGAIGTFIGGPLSDRFGGKAVITGSLLISAPLIALIPVVGDSTLALPLLIVAGFALISSFAVTTVFGQVLLPRHVGLASGLTLGASVGTGGLSVVPLGWIGDHWGLTATFIFTGILALIGGLFAMGLPGIQTHRST